MQHPHRAAVAAAAAVAVLALSGCVSEAPSAPAESVGPTWELPPPGAALDYQLGGAYDPVDAVGIVVRDREAQPADGLYSICYVNGFQTQPGELGLWPEEVLLRDDDGQPLVDPSWPDEVLLDSSTAEKRDAIVAIVAPWIQGCADAAYAAVEFDNLDSFTRSDGALTVADNTALARALVTVAHEAGLAAGQKNAAELSATLRTEAGFDFAVAEECVAYDECASYTAVYGEHVLAIEYPDTLTTPFADACADPHTPASVVLRDRDLVTPDDPGYVFELC